jgi:hypothetical protein
MGGPGSGCHIPLSIRRLIHYNRHTLHKGYVEIHELICGENPESISLGRIRDLCSWFDKNEDEVSDLRSDWCMLSYFRF